MHKLSIWKRFREWLQRDVKLEIWDPHKGIVAEKDLKDVFIRAKLFSQDDQPTRKLFSHGPNSFAITVNPRFVNALCPFKEKHVKQELLKQENGQYLLTIQGVPEHE